jgi:F0F1-type ATP synthase membrane subunit b/b'
MDMNKIIKHFQDGLTNNKLKVADNKINYLEESLDKAKRENQNMKNNNGSKEALRAEVEKCHQIIDSLKKENK